MRKLLLLPLLLLAACGGETEPATNVGSTTATGNAIAGCKADLSGSYVWQTKTASGNWTDQGAPVAFDCPPDQDPNTPGYQWGRPDVPITQSFTGLAPSTTYQFRLEATLSNGSKVHNDSVGATNGENYDSFTTAANPPPPPEVTLQPVDGGPNYYGQFSNPLPTTPGYFPIGVWGSYDQFGTTGGVRNIDLDAQVGLNTYVWLADPCNQAPLVRSDGRFRVIYDQSENRSCIGSESAGWVLHDEIEMQQGPGACNGSLQAIKNSLPADGRFRYNNYGKGIFPGWETDAQFACFVNAQQVTSDDIYWFSDPNACSSLAEGPSFFGLNRALTQAECRRAANYGYVIDRMRQLDVFGGSPRQPIWTFVEVSHPFSEAPPQSPNITDAQIRAAVWHSLIAGARGIIYFQHSFGAGQPCFGNHHTLRNDCHGHRAAVRAVNEQVKALAPVLNAPTVNGLVSTSPGVRTMAKWQGGKFYVFAGRTQNGGSSSNTISVPCVGNATAVVEGEGRSVPVNNGQFSDTFADGNAVHIYRIDGGSSCGL